MDGDGDDDDRSFTLGELAVALLVYVARKLAYSIGVPLALAWGEDLYYGRPLARLPWTRGMMRLPWLVVVLALLTPPWWIFRRVTRGRELRVAATVAFVVGVPMLVAWAEKLAYHAGRRLRTGSADWDHVFRLEHSNTTAYVALRMGVDDILLGTTPYVTRGLAPSWPHWCMGALSTAYCLLWVGFVWAAWRAACAVRRGILSVAATRRRAHRRPAAAAPRTPAH
jgi:hypothetical protein